MYRPELFLFMCDDDILRLLLIALGCVFSLAYRLISEIFSSHVSFQDNTLTRYAGVCRLIRYKPLHM